MANLLLSIKVQWANHTAHVFPRESASSRRSSGGFTYVGILILVAIIGIASAATIQVGSVLQRRAAEEALLEIGMEFRGALTSYANATPPGQLRAPKTLQELLKDPRSPNLRRHLRKLYADPLTGKEEWGIVHSPDGVGIIGLYSLSDATPIKIGNFDAPFKDFEGKTSYRDWKFVGEVQFFGLLNQGAKPPMINNKL